MIHSSLFCFRGLDKFNSGEGCDDGGGYGVGAGGLVYLADGQDGCHWFGPEDGFLQNSDIGFSRCVNNVCSGCRVDFEGFKNAGCVVLYYDVPGLDYVNGRKIRYVERSSSRYVAEVPYDDHGVFSVIDQGGGVA